MSKPFTRLQRVLPPSRNGPWPRFLDHASRGGGTPIAPAFSTSDLATPGARRDSGHHGQGPLLQEIAAPAMGLQALSRQRRRSCREDDEVGYGITRAIAPRAPLLRLVSLTLTLALLLAACAGTPPAGTESTQTKAEEPSKSLDAATVAAFQRALTLLRAGHYAEATEVLSPIARAHPELPGPLVNLAIAYIHLARQQEAVAALSKALAADPEHPVALNWMAILHRRSGRFQEAQATYERLLASHPEYRYGHLNLGILCDLYLQQPGCALEHYRRYRELGGGQDDQDQQVAGWIADLERRSRR